MATFRAFGAIFASHSLACKCLDFRYSPNIFRTLIAQSFRFTFRCRSSTRSQFGVCAFVWHSALLLFSFYFSCHSLTCIQFDFTFILMRISFRLWIRPIPHRRYRSFGVPFAARASERMLLERNESLITVLDEPIVFILLLLFRRACSAPSLAMHALPTELVLSDPVCVCVLCVLLSPLSQCVRCAYIFISFAERFCHVLTFLLSFHACACGPCLLCHRKLGHAHTHAYNSHAYFGVVSLEFCAYIKFNDVIETFFACHASTIHHHHHHAPATSG